VASLLAVAGQAKRRMKGDRKKPGSSRCSKCFIDRLEHLDCSVSHFFRRWLVCRVFVGG
jgi:hypothetical protein